MRTKALLVASALGGAGLMALTTTADAAPKQDTGPASTIAIMVDAKVNNATSMSISCNGAPDQNLSTDTGDGTLILANQSPGNYICHIIIKAN